jgi:2,3-bisphosphoglycerate-independent phosphoglycerate mutase
MKYVVVLGGGLADEGSAALGGKTPLDVAATPHLDHLASRGILGLTRTIPAGLPATRAIGTLSALGYDPSRQAAAASTLEAAALGVRLGPDDVVFHCDLVTFGVAENGDEVMRDPVGGSPTAAEGRDLIAALAAALGREGFELHAGRGHHHLLVWRRGERGVRTTAPHALIDKPIAPVMPAGPGSEPLRELIERSRTVLSEHPVCRERLARGEAVPNAIWPWGPGGAVELPGWAASHGVEGSVVAQADLMNGLAILVGLARVAAPAADVIGDETRRGVAAGVAALAARDFLLVHVEDAGECAQAGDAAGKVAAIERLDADVVGPLLEGLRQCGDEWRVLVLPDVATSSTQRMHLAEPVPFVVYTSADERKTAGPHRGYSERDARDQGIFIPEAHSLVEKLLRR